MVAIGVSRLSTTRSCVRVVVVVEVGVVDFADSVAACGLACLLKMHLLDVVFWCWVVYVRRIAFLLSKYARDG